MDKGVSPRDGKRRGGFFANLREAFANPRVALRPKLIVAAALLYVLVPFDIIPDFLPIGFADDFAALLAGGQALLTVLAQHRASRKGRDGPDGDGPIIDI